MSAEAMAQCPNHTWTGKSEVTTPSLLYNAMIQPFAPLVIASFLWWQGESNAWTVANAEEYSCNQKAMITDLRAKFDGADALLPFIFVQSFPLFGDLSKFQPYPGSSGAASVLEGLSELRQSQADSLSLPGVGMAVSIDLGDVGCPFTWEHNRAKRPCAHRAALAARALVYNETSLIYRGPEAKHVEIIPIECSHGGCGPGAGHQYVELAITFEMYGSKGFHRSPMLPLSVLSFEILFTDNATAHAGGGGSSSSSSSSSSGSESSSAWVPASLLPVEGNSRAINPGDTIGIGATAFFAKQPVPRAVRYAHGDFPTGILHNAEGLPVAPFLVEIP
jgi:hypothetical protein